MDNGEKMELGGALQKTEEILFLLSIPSVLLSMLHKVSRICTNTTNLPGGIILMIPYYDNLIHTL